MDVQTLTAEQAAVVKQAQDLINEQKQSKTALPADKKATLDRLWGRVLELKTEIADAEDLEAKAADLNKIHDFLAAPKYKLPRTSTERVGNGDTETGKALSAMGWETKSDMVYAPTSLGHLVPYAPSALLYGPMPEGNDPKIDELKSYYRKQRAIFQPEYRDIWLKWMRKSIELHDPASALIFLEDYERKALSEGTDTAGGFLVPPDVQAEILVRLPMASVFRQLARVVPTSRDFLAFPMIQPNTTTNNGSIYTSGFVGDWAPETPVFADTNPGFNSFTIGVRKIRCATKVSNDLIADSVFPFLAFLAQDGSLNMGLVEDNGFITGQTSYFANGAAVTTQAVNLQPLGILASLLSGTTNSVAIAGTTAHTISGLGASTSSAPLILALQANLPQQYQPKAVWLTHRLNELHIRQLTDTTGRFIFAPGYMSPTGSAGEEFSMLQGKKLYRSDFIPLDGTANNPVAIYGDFSNYIIASRAGISTTILRERFADTDQTGIILWERVGGALWNTDSVRFGTV